MTVAEAASCNSVAILAFLCLCNAFLWLTTIILFHTLGTISYVQPGRSGLSVPHFIREYIQFAIIGNEAYIKLKVILFKSQLPSLGTPTSAASFNGGPWEYTNSACNSQINRLDTASSHKFIMRSKKQNEHDIGIMSNPGLFLLAPLTFRRAVRGVLACTRVRTSTALLSVITSWRLCT